VRKGDPAQGGVTQPRHLAGKQGDGVKAITAVAGYGISHLLKWLKTILRQIIVAPKIRTNEQTA